jgi:hypothetical protein
MFFTSLGLIVLSGFCMLTLGSPAVAGHDDFVQWGVINRPFNKILAHTSKEQFLTVKGRIYRKVRGVAPHYLWLPDKTAFLFVTDTGDGNAKLHVISTNDWKDVSISCDKISFGNNIVPGKVTSEPFTDSIESSSDETLILVSRGLSSKSRYLVNRKARRLDRIQYQEFDGVGRLTADRWYNWPF